MRHLIMVMTLIGLVACQSSAQSQTWRELFNGRDLTGWEQIGPGKVTVEDGEMVLRWDPEKSVKKDGRGWFLHEETFENFRMQVDFYAPNAVNSGLTIRFQGQPDDDPAYYAYEIQIYNDQDKKPKFQSATGSIFTLSRAFYKGIDPDGWNSFDITANGDHIVVKVNGEKLTEIHDRRSLRGKVGFQIHDPTTFAKLRNIRIQELPATPNLGPQLEDWMRMRNGDFAREHLFNGTDLSGWHTVGSADWSVRDGAIVGENPGPKGGFLVTDKSYSNYYMRLKFKIQLDHNSGAWIRWDESGETPSLESSLEINIYDHSDYTWANPTGAIANIARSYNGKVDYDDWNTMEIFTFDDHVIVFVNGEKASEAHVPAQQPGEGKICLQVGRQIPSGKTSRVEFKDIYVRDFSKYIRAGQ
jgi:hypothetical protein